MSREELGDLLWPDDFPDVTRGRLRQELSRLKLALGPAAEILDIDRTWIRLRAERAETDLGFIRAALVSGDPHRLREARELAVGQLTPELIEPWLLPEQEAAEQLVRELDHRPMAQPAGGLTSGSWPTAPPVSFTVGRTRELEFLVSALKPNGYASLVTILGEGGIGKTHLARSAFCELSAAYPDRVAYITLEGSRNRSVRRDVLARLGASEASSVSEAVGAEPALLILDNVEQCLQGAIDIATEIKNSPNCRLLITSRIPLDMNEEHRLPLGPLSVPDCKADAVEILGFEATDLFVRLGRRMRPQLSPAESELGEWRLLMQRLEGVPLAIELAAAQLERFPVREVLENLDHSFTNLASRQLDRPTRQGSLQSAFEWSWRLLDEDERHALALMAAFPAGILISQVPAVLGPEGEELIHRFVSHSLVRLENDGAGDRRALLRQTTREFALAELPHDQQPAMWGQMTHSLVGLIRRYAKQMTEVEQDLAFQRVGEEAPNLRVAIQSPHCSDRDKVSLMYGVWRYGTARGEPAEWLELFARELKLLNVDPSWELAEAWLGLAILGQASGRWEVVVQAFERSISIFRAHGSLYGQSWALTNLATHLIELRRYQESLAATEHALALLERPSVSQTVLPRAAKATALAYLGRYEEAIPLMENVFADRIASTDVAERAKAHAELAMVLYQAGQDHDALSLAKTGVRTSGESGIQDFLSYALAVRIEVGWTHEGHIPESVFEESDRIARRLRDARTQIRLSALRARQSGDAAGFANALEAAMRKGFDQELVGSLLLAGNEDGLDGLQLALDIAAATNQEFSAREQSRISGLQANPHGWHARLAVYAANLRELSRF